MKGHTLPGINQRADSPLKLAPVIIAAIITGAAAVGSAMINKSAAKAGEEDEESKVKDFAKKDLGTEDSTSSTSSTPSGVPTAVLPDVQPVVVDTKQTKK